MTLLGLELNASLARAVRGPHSEFPLPCALDPPALDLPLVLNIGQDPPQIGRAATRMLRLLPHVCCQKFLPHLGDARRWGGRDHRLDSSEALALVWLYLRAACGPHDGAVLSLPGYLDHAQVQQVQALAERAGMPVLGCISSHLAAGLAGYAQQGWFGATLILDIDDHAFTVAQLRSADGQAHVLDGRYYPHLGLAAWKESVLNALADCCVRQSRRDPRDAAAAEQTLFEHIDPLFDASARGRLLNVGLKSDHWFQNLIVQPEHTLGICAGMVRQVIHELELFWKASRHELEPRTILITSAVAHLPGLAAAVREFADTWIGRGRPFHGGNGTPAALADDDFGEDLVAHGGYDKATVVILSADATARGAHLVAPHFQDGELTGLAERLAPLPLPMPVEAGPPRLYFLGQDFPLNERCFSLGYLAACDLVFDPSRHPTVEPRHCEISLDHRTFLLFDRSREGTWVNDTPVAGSLVLKAGDWIRLGHEGPQLRFLGQAAHRLPVLSPTR